MSATSFISTPGGVRDLVDSILLRGEGYGDYEPPLYIDIEGERLGRHGKVSLLTVLSYFGSSLTRSYLIDIHTLGQSAFSTVSQNGKSLKDILESPQLLKVFFDVRNDSDALYTHYGISLQGVLDLQLMESARRRTTSSRKFVAGLAKCIQDSCQGEEKREWLRCKEKGESLWDPKKGGSYDAFNERPLPQELISYCVGDVQHLPSLYRKYNCGTTRWKDLIAAESQKRISLSQRANYEPQGPGRALSPWNAEQNKLLDSWSEVNPPPMDYFSYQNENDYWSENDTGNDYEDWTRAPWQGPPS